MGLIKQHEPNIKIKYFLDAWAEDSLIFGDYPSIRGAGTKASPESRPDYLVIPDANTGQEHTTCQLTRTLQSSSCGGRDPGPYLAAGVALWLAGICLEKKMHSPHALASRYK